MKTVEIAASLGALSGKWLRRSFSYRRKAVRRLVIQSGFAPQAAERMLDALFHELTVPKLKKLLRAEIGNPNLLDGPMSGPGQITHILSGNIPNPGIQSIVHGLLVQSRNAVKPSSRDQGITDIYIQSLRSHNRLLYARCQLLSPSSRTALARSISSSDLVIVYGSDESVEAVRSSLRPGTGFEGYGHRVSFSFYTKGSLSSALAKKTALDIWMMDRRGCLSPALIFVEDSPGLDDFYKKIVRELSRLEDQEGKVRARVSRAALIRAVYQEARWAKDPFFGQTPKGRYFVRASRRGAFRWSEASGAEIRVVRRIQEAYPFLKKMARHLQAASLECAPGDRRKLSGQLAAIGFNRICRAGRLQFPPVDWPHDGRPNFSSWLKWPARKNGKIVR